MNSDIFVAWLLLMIAFAFKCNGKYVTNNSLDLFPIRKLARSSITWESNQTVTKFSDNLEYIIDGDSKTFWRGPSLVNGNEFQEVNLTFHFDQVVHIAKLSIEFEGSKHAPAIWSLESSIDHGKTWSVREYIVKNPDDCELLGVESSTDDNFAAGNVSCSPHQYQANRPIVIDLLRNHQLTTNNVTYGDAMNEWTRTTSIRLRFYGLKMDLKYFPLLKDPNITETYFYAVKDIEIMGYCEPNGHFNGERGEFGYHCKHNTEGVCCNQCKSGFVKNVRTSSTQDLPFECEPCHCNGHSDRCNNDEDNGDSVCQDCQHNTTGSSCDRCKPGFYRAFGKNWNDTDVCKPCDCEAFFFNGNCSDETGKCDCKIEYQGPHCASCSMGYSGYPNCKQCSIEGTKFNESSSQNNGACSCKPNFDGQFCDKCKSTTAKYPKCTEIDSNKIKPTDPEIEPFLNFAKLFEAFVAIEEEQRSHRIKN